MLQIHSWYPKLHTFIYIPTTFTFLYNTLKYLSELWPNQQHSNCRKSGSNPKWLLIHSWRWWFYSNTQVKGVNWNVDILIQSWALFCDLELGLASRLRYLYNLNASGVLSRNDRNYCNLFEFCENNITKLPRTLLKIFIDS